MRANAGQPTCHTWGPPQLAGSPVEGCGRPVCVSTNRGGPRPMPPTFFTEMSGHVGCSEGT